MTKVLFVVTGTTFWPLNDGTRHPTGYWAEEFVANPYTWINSGGVGTIGYSIPVEMGPRPRVPSRRCGPSTATAASR